MIYEEEDWYYNSARCPGGCGRVVGLLNRFRYIRFSTANCPICGKMPDPCSAEEMAPEPVTLRVKIYKQTYNVTYPSLKRVEDLKREYATMAKGALKPGSKRKYFLCIYCGKDHYSNKMMLNKHRFVEGCEQAKYPDGKKALLLPYPDFRTGEGKKVEVLGKKTVAGSKSQDKQHVNSEDEGDDEAGADSDADDFETELLNRGGSTSAGEMMDSSVAEVRGVAGTTVNIPEDLLYKVPYKGEGRECRSRGTGTGKSTIAKVLSTEAPKMKKTVGKKNRGAGTGEPNKAHGGGSGSAVNVLLKDSVTEGQRSLRVTSGQVKGGTGDVSPQIRALEKFCTPDLDPHEEREILPNEVRGSPMFCDTNRAEASDVVGDGVPGFVRDPLKRKACSDDDMESFKVFVRDPLVHRKLKLPRCTTNTVSDVSYLYSFL